MINNLCDPCDNKKSTETKNTSTVKWIRYKKSEDNSSDIIDKLKNKKCVPDLYESFVMKDPKNPTDKFNEDEYNAYVESILNEPPLVPPDID